MGNVCRKNGEMPISDYFEMSNWEKWRVYNRFPYKMVLAIFLTILTTSHVLILNSYLAPYRRAGYTSWASLLAPPIQPEPPTYAVYETRGKVNLEKIDAFIASVKHVSDAYYSLTTTSVDRMEYYVDGNTHQIVQPVMEVVSYESDDIFNPTGAGYTHSAIRTDSYHINMTNPLGPFQIPGTHTSNDDNAIDTSGSTSTDLSGINLSLIRRLVEMKVTFPMVVWSVDEGGRSCHAWSVKSLWTFRVRGRIGYSVDSRVTLCNGETRETPLVWDRENSTEYSLLNLIIVLAVLHQMLVLKSLYTRIVYVQRAQRNCLWMKTVQSERNSAGIRGSVHLHSASEGSGNTNTNTNANDINDINNINNNSHNNDNNDNYNNNNNTKNNNNNNDCNNKNNNKNNNNTNNTNNTNITNNTTTTTNDDDDNNNGDNDNNNNNDNDHDHCANKSDSNNDNNTIYSNYLYSNGGGSGSMTSTEIELGFPGSSSSSSNSNSNSSDRKRPKSYGMRSSFSSTPMLSSPLLPTSGSADSYSLLSSSVPPPSSSSSSSSSSPAPRVGLSSLPLSNERSVSDTLQNFAGLTLSQKMQFINVWFLSSSIANISNVLAAFLCLQNLAGHENVQSTYRLLFLGLGVSMCWFNLVQYYEKNPEYYVLMMTLRKGGPKVLAFLAGTLPIFLGMCFFGVAFFSSSTLYFSSVMSAVITLFALLNGDVIHDCFDELTSIQPLISCVFLYLSISLFMYAVLNIMIAINEESFFALKAKQKEADQQKDWMRQVLALMEMDPDNASRDGPDFQNSSSSSNGRQMGEGEREGEGGGGTGGEKKLSHFHEPLYHPRQLSRLSLLSNHSRESLPPSSSLDFGVDRLEPSLLSMPRSFPRTGSRDSTTTVKGDHNNNRDGMDDYQKHSYQNASHHVRARVSSQDSSYLMPLSMPNPPSSSSSCSSTQLYSPRALEQRATFARIAQEATSQAQHEREKDKHNHRRHSHLNNSNNNIREMNHVSASISAPDLGSSASTGVAPSSGDKKTLKKRTVSFKDI